MTDFSTSQPLDQSTYAYNLTTHIFLFYLPLSTLERHDGWPEQPQGPQQYASFANDGCITRR